MSRVYHSELLDRQVMPPFPASEFDQAAMHSLDALCQDGLVRGGTAFVVVVSGGGSSAGPGVGVFSVPDKQREAKLHHVRSMLSLLSNDIRAVGFVELVLRCGLPHHSLHIENPSVCVGMARCAFLDEAGNPVSGGVPGVEHMSMFHAAPDGVAFWRRRKPPRKAGHADWHEVIDKPKRKRRPKDAG